MTNSPPPDPLSDLSIETKRLPKSSGADVVIDLAARRREIFGLIGSNGAGKSTVIGALVVVAGICIADRAAAEAIRIPATVDPHQGPAGPAMRRPDHALPFRRGRP